MDRKPIGMFAFGRSPVEHMPPMRIRALLAEAALQGAELVFSSVADCDPETGTVLAAAWTGSGWERRRVPLPRVVVITDPASPRNRQVEAWLRAATRLVDSNGPDKAEQTKILEQSALARYAIPFTTITTGSLERDLAEWLSEHGAAVVKPVDGGRGNNVKFIKPAGRNWKLTERRGTREGALAEMIEALRAAIAGRMRYRQFIVQRYIKSTLAGHAFSLRIDVHKKPNGSWGATRAAIMLNALGGLATNMAGGGGQFVIEKLLPLRTARPPDAIFEEAVAAACEAAQLFDREPAVSVFEFGIDMALDPDDRLWMLEANAHPGANWAEQDRAMHVIAYALSLAG